MNGRLVAAVLAAGMAVSACGSEERPGPDPADSLVFLALSGIPLMPGAQVGDVGGEGGTGTASLHIRRPPDSVATWYRRALIQRRWSIVSDVRTPDGTVTLHATDARQRPIWLLIGSEGPGTLVRVVGAVPVADTTKQ
jgi:hypothetical protein